MSSKMFPRVRGLCNALPKTKLDKQFESLSLLQQLLVLVITSAVVLMGSLWVVDAVVAAVFAFGIMSAVTNLLVRYNQR
jgi:hypothetical protein